MAENHASGATFGEYVSQFDFQPGWIDLTLEYAIHADALGLAGAVMQRDFKAIERTVSDRDLLNDLIDRALFLNKKEPQLAAAYYTSGGVGLADLWVDSYGDEGKDRPQPAEVTPILLDWSNGKVVGEPDIRYLDLGAGSAVRVQALLKAKRLLGFGAKLAEFIRYAVFPPQVNYFVVVTVMWRNMAVSDELVRLTDELVSSMRLTPVSTVMEENSQDE
ncbi:hypothetical protein [Streptomyces sp. NPDC056405]|uniref:hypothetical protein n=1 Tax=Streptomyces sp. NPDC056405 TaxID=3345811 RepID=UPI0035D783E0